jgi:hypothetical protein
MNTALILRDPMQPPIHVLECDGPAIYPIPDIHRYPGDFDARPYMSFQNFLDLPDYAKKPGPSTWEMEHANARRIYRLIEHAETGFNVLTPSQLQEIRARLKLIAPECDQDF